MIKHKNNRQKRLLIFILLLVLALGLFAGWWFLIRESSDPSTPYDETTETINYDPPTETEKSESENRKDKIVKQQEAENSKPSSAAGQKKTISVIITNWGTEGSRFDVGAYANTVDEAGSCTITLKKGSVTLSGSSTAVPNPTTMSCGSLSVDSTKVSAGSWTGTVNYSSQSATGTVTRQIEVQ